MTEELLYKSVGGWQLTSYIASGKSALVFKGERDGVVGAVKIFDPELIERFGEDVQTARISRELTLKNDSHDNLIGILDGGMCTIHKLYYVIMQYLDEPNLATVLSDVPRGRIWPLVSQVAAAARFLETKGLAHRDIKPENIAISRDFSHATLLDLGVIRPIGDSGLTDDEHRVFIGTLQYSSPEFLFRKEIDSQDGWRAVTFYQLGAVLHDLIMRRRIFQDFIHPYGLLVQMVEHQVPVIDAADVPPNLVLLAKNCLSKDPLHRLRFVKWEDFNVREMDDTSPAEAKERIRRRLQQNQATSPELVDVEAEREKRAVQRSLDQIRSLVHNSISEECIGSGLFPPLEIHDLLSPQLEAIVEVRFCASPEHGIRQLLHLLFSIKLLDRHSQAIQIRFVAALGDNGLTWDSSSDSRARPVFEGVLEESVLRKQLNNSLYITLDLAQRHSDTSNPEKTWLDPSIMP